MLKRCPVLTEITCLPYHHLHEPLDTDFVQRMNMLPKDKMPETEVSLRIAFFFIEQRRTASADDATRTAPRNDIKFYHFRFRHSQKLC